MQRLRLLVADLVVFDRHRLGWRLAARTLLAFLLPLLAAKLLGLPVLVYMALGGFLVAIGDSVDDGDRAQFLRVAIGSLAGGAAVACGVLAGGTLVLALAGTLFWALFAALLGIYGNAFATMGLPIAWAYVEVGLPAARHDLPFAVLLGALWIAGGCLAALLTLWVRTGDADATLRHRCADCYRALARYFDALHQRDDAVVSPETRLRAAIGEARRIAANRRSPSQRMQRQMALIDIADRLFSEAARLHEEDLPASPTLVEALDALASLSRDVASAVSSRAPQIDGLIARLRRVEDNVPHAVCQRAARELAAALRTAGDGTPTSPELSASPPTQLSWAAPVLIPLHDCLSWQSIVSRHALRFALVTCAAVGVFWVFPPPFGYWVPLTVTVVLKPYAGVTVSRTVQRVVGTVSGVLIATALMPLLPGMATQITAAAAAFFCLMLVLPFNYSLAVFFLSLGVVPFEHAMMPGLALDVGLLRVVATAIGGALGLIGGHLLWPSFERRELPALLQRSLRSAAAYAAAALGSTALAEKRRAAGLDTTNFHMSAQRALSEFGLAAHDRDNIAVAAASLQQLMLAINALALEAAKPDAEAKKLLIDLAEGRTGGHDVANALRRLPAASPGLPLHRVGAEIETLTHCQENWS
jgi:uncharacterized membrane protein YccC